MQKKLQVERQKEKKHNIQARFHIKFLALYLMLLPVATGLSGIIGDISLLNYIAVLYIGFSFLYQKMKIVINPKVSFVYLYFLFTVLSMAYNPYFILNWYVTTFLCNTLIVIIALSDNYTKLELALIQKAIIISAIISGIVTVFNIDSALKLRLEITLASTMDSNDFACGLMIIISLLFTMLHNKQQKSLSITLLIVCMTISILSGSRGAMAMFLGITACWLVICTKSKKILIPLLTIIIALIFFFLFYDYLPEFLKYRMNVQSVLEDGGAGRFKIWNAAINAFDESGFLNKLMGHGYGSFKRSVKYTTSAHSAYYESHNMWINELIEGGIIGLVFMAGMFIQTFLYAKKRGNICGMMAIVGLFTAGCSLDSQSYRIFAVVFVIAVIFKGRDFKKNRRKHIMRHRHLRGKKHSRSKYIRPPERYKHKHKHQHQHQYLDRMPENDINSCIRKKPLR